MGVPATGEVGLAQTQTQPIAAEQQLLPPAMLPLGELADGGLVLEGLVLEGLWYDPGADELPGLQQQHQQQQRHAALARRSAMPAGPAEPVPPQPVSPPPVTVSVPPVSPPSSLLPRPDTQHHRKVTMQQRKEMTARVWELTMLGELAVLGQDKILTDAADAAVTKFSSTEAGPRFAYTDENVRPDAYTQNVNGSGGLMAIARNTVMRSVVWRLERLGGSADCPEGPYASKLVIGESRRRMMDRNDIAAHEEDRWKLKKSQYFRKLTEEEGASANPQHWVQGANYKDLPPLDPENLKFLKDQDVSKFDEEWCKFPARPRGASSKLKKGSSDKKIAKEGVEEDAVVNPDVKGEVKSEHSDLDPAHFMRVAEPSIRAQLKNLRRSELNKQVLELVKDEKSFVTQECYDAAIDEDDHTRHEVFVEIVTKNMMHNLDKNFALKCIEEERERLQTELSKVEQLQLDKKTMTDKAIRRDSELEEFRTKHDKLLMEIGTLRAEAIAKDRDLDGMQRELDDALVLAAKVEPLLKEVEKQRQLNIELGEEATRRSVTNENNKRGLEDGSISTCLDVERATKRQHHEASEKLNIEFVGRQGGDKSICVDYSPEDSVADLKAKIFNMEAIHVDKQRLIFKGKELRDSMKLHLAPPSTIHLSVKSNFRLAYDTQEKHKAAFSSMRKGSELDDDEESSSDEDDSDSDDDVPKAVP